MYLDSYHTLCIDFIVLVIVYYCDGRGTLEEKRKRNDPLDWWPPLPNKREPAISRGDKQSVCRPRTACRTSVRREVLLFVRVTVALYAEMCFHIRSIVPLFLVYLTTLYQIQGIYPRSKTQIISSAKDTTFFHRGDVIMTQLCCSQRWPSWL